MSADVQPRSWWAALGVVFATYTYFLIFAEFALLALAERQGFAGVGQRGLLSALGAGGIAGAVAGWRIFRVERAQPLLRRALAGAAVAALIAPLVRGGVLLGGVFGATGFFLGLLTVVLASSLRAAAGMDGLGRCIGIGTGMAYALCNVPWVFEADPCWQAGGAGLVAVAALVLVPRLEVSGSAVREARPARREAVRWIAALTALVWLDSAAFFVIQHTDVMREAMWHGAVTLWGNAVMHAGLAWAAGWMLDRGWWRTPAVLAIVFLAYAVGQLAGGGRSVVPVQWWYTAGVSLYSVALVYVPARTGSAGWAAGTFAVAGWVGSALGIGMAQDLGGVPVWAGAGALVVVLTALGGSKWGRAGAVVLAVAVSVPRAGAVDDEWARGREVYVREGCIHCHSQYVRPQVAADVQWWGPTPTVEEMKRGEPPLLGNRRQGPDLTNVGARRSAEWNRLHLIKPRAVTPGSRMPSYAHLFRGVDSDGEALVHYLGSLGQERLLARLAAVRTWRPDPVTPISRERAAEVFQRLCANCHGHEGRGDGGLAGELSVRPPNWRAEGWRHVRTESDAEREVARIVKFGLPGSPMAGHEYLPDEAIVGLARLLKSWQKTDPSQSARP